MFLIQVALPVPIYGVFDYYCHALPVIGGRVRVPFGNRELVGITTAHLDKSDINPTLIKSVIEVIDDAPIFDEKLLNFAKWLSSYYVYPLGETFAVMLPSLLKQGEPALTPARLWQTCTDEDTAKSTLKTTKAQLHAFATLYATDGMTDNELKTAGISPRTLHALADKGLICSTNAVPAPKTISLNSPHLPLTDEQTVAKTAIDNAITTGIYQGILLYGITGSGKTEVYLQAIHTALDMGKQVLLLVPEIGLTPQSRERFAKRFCANIIVLHSGLNDRERLDGWKACQSGSAQIIIATRSALFYPFANLGLIIIDEAHDNSYKQQDHLRYHACDVALYLASRTHTPVVLGTATPSLEQLKLVADGKLSCYRLNIRATGQTTPFYLVDTRLGTTWHTNQAGDTVDSRLAPLTIERIRHTLQKGEQVLIFLNRRGFAPILLCEACGHQADCVRCSSHLTVHKPKTRPPYLKCHHCSYQMSMPNACPNCHSLNIITLGQGTSALHEHLHALFANPQNSSQTYPILQIDRDTVQTKGAWEKIYATINTGEPMILVGTQMLAKGHHFDNVTLVVVVDADTGFLSPNFRSPEHTAQTIMQVAGRAGRADKAGQVLIQTYTPDHPLLNILVKHGYDMLAQKLLQERQGLGLPPYSHAVLVQASSHRADVAKGAIMQAKTLLTQPPFAPHPFAILAPIEAPLFKKNNHYHYQMLILAKERKSLHTILPTFWERVLTLPNLQGAKMVIEIDPMGW
ncbi:replication restart helicase PriA [Moraxella oblonga]|uniref:replication restart helicase PriA n=1 Tax=Moraxella oblonga TaxID=200413 RepID=UPI000836CC00|nr:primosomal protein N' [Moraxella oblonga]